MSRFIKEIELDQPLDVVSMIMEDYLYHNQFRRTDWNGEMVFYMQDRHGKDRYMQWSYTGGVFRVEAWLKNALGGEQDLDGVGGGKSRKEFRESIDGLIAKVRNQSAAHISGGHVGGDPLHHSRNYQAEHSAWKAASDRQMSAGTSSTVNRTAGSGSTGGARRQNTSFGSGISGNPGLVFAILALVFSTVLPILGIVFGVIGLQKYQGDLGSNGRVWRILCIVGIVLSIISVVFSFLMQLTILPF